MTQEIHADWPAACEGSQRLTCASDTKGMWVSEELLQPLTGRELLQGKAAYLDFVTCALGQCLVSGGGSENVCDINRWRGSIWTKRCAERWTFQGRFPGPQGDRGALTRVLGLQFQACSCTRSWAPDMGPEPHCGAG